MKDTPFRTTRTMKTSVGNSSNSIRRMVSNSSSSNSSSSRNHKISISNLNMKPQPFSNIAKDQTCRELLQHQTDDSTGESTPGPTTVPNEPISDHALPPRPDHTLTLKTLLQGLEKMPFPNREEGARLNVFQDRQQISNQQLNFVASLLVSMDTSSQNPRQRNPPTGGFLPGGSALNTVVLGTLQQLGISEHLSASIAPQQHQSVRGLFLQANKQADSRTATRQLIAPAPQTRVSTPPVSQNTGTPSSPLNNSPVVLTGGRKSKTVPCRARGLASDHNATTAYFIIPNDICHAANLVCSHHECRNRGIKFRYCAVCGIPVARRNFRQRHDHVRSVTTPAVVGSNNKRKGVLKNALVPPKTVVTERRVTSEPSDGGAHVSHHGTRVTDDARSMPTTSQLSPSQADTIGEGRRTKRSYEEDVIDNESLSTDPAEPKRQRHEEFPDGVPENIRFRHRKPSSTTKGLEQRMESGQSITDHERAEKVSADDTANDSISMDDEGRRMMKWLSLLQDRPLSGDQEGMTFWIMRVLHVSDRATPCRRRGRTRRTGSSETGSSSTSTYDTEEGPQEQEGTQSPPPHDRKREMQECDRHCD